MSSNKKRYLSEISKETESYFPEMKKAFSKEINQSINDTWLFTDYTTVSQTNHERGNYKKSETEVSVNVVNKDSINCALSLKRQGFNPLVLNMASDRVPGGGWRHGSLAQEEELFRRTTYALSLENPRIRSKYPLGPVSGIYSPSVMVFRGDRNSNYYVYDWDKCTTLDFVAVPAVRRPPLTPDNRLTPHNEKLTEHKIRLIFEIAIHYGHDCLVLSAFGNGAFGNPPLHSAEIFKRVIEDYRIYFRNITFAILTDQNDRFGNLKSYKQVLLT